MDEPHDSSLVPLVIIADLHNDTANILHNLQTITEMEMMIMEMKMGSQVEAYMETMMINHSEMLQKY